MNIISVSNNLDPDQAQHFVGPDLVPNCLQKLSADNKSHHKQIDELFVCAAALHPSQQFSVISGHTPAFLG